MQVVLLTVSMHQMSGQHMTNQGTPYLPTTPAIIDGDNSCFDDIAEFGA